MVQNYYEIPEQRFFMPVDLSEIAHFLPPSAPKRLSRRLIARLTAPFRLSVRRLSIPLVFIHVKINSSRCVGPSGMFSGGPECPLKICIPPSGCRYMAKNSAFLHLHNPIIGAAAVMWSGRSVYPEFVVIFAFARTL